MANFLGTIRSSAAAMAALQHSIAASQNNVNNASTPGYARQTLSLQALEFSPESGLLGGVSVKGLTSSRDEYAEFNVRSQVARLGEVEQSAANLSWVESSFDLNDSTGIAATMDRLFTSFSAWTVAPNSAAAKEGILAAAADLANGFSKTAGELQRSASEAQEQIGSTIDEINHIAGQIRAVNVARRAGAGDDAGVDAELHVALEKLAALVDFKAQRQDDGTVTILVGGEAALVVGDQVNEIRADFANTDPSPLHPDATPKAHIIDAVGNNVTSRIHSGKLRSLIDFRNETIPHYLGDTQNVGQLNRLAKAVADRINNILAAGYPAPQEPYHLFIYGSSPTSIAHSLRVNPTLAPALMDATSHPPAEVAVNGKALQLAALAHPDNAADKLDGLSYVTFIGKISSHAGRELSLAKQDLDSRKQLTAQARNLRNEIAGVSLDEEAVRLVEFQRAYQAAARVVSVLDELTQIAVNIGRA